MNRTAIWKLLDPRIKADYATDFSGAVAVTAAPFNRYLPGHKPDESNAAIALLAKFYCLRYRLPFLGQFEHTSIVRDAGIRVEEYSSVAGEWVYTRNLARWTAHIVRNRLRGTKVIHVGHPHHVRRSGIMLEYYGLEPMISSLCERVPYDPRTREGDQWWCRSRATYLFPFPWEYLARADAVLSHLRGTL